MKTVVVAILTIALGAPLAAQWLTHPTPGIPRTPDGRPNLTAAAPRTPDGKPDLSGLWTKVSPKYSRNIAADLKTAEILPGRAKSSKNAARTREGRRQVRCLPLGPAYATSGDSTGSEMVRIVQTPQLIVMLNPDLHLSPDLDGRPLAGTRSNRPGWGTRWATGTARRWWSKATGSTQEPGSPRRPPAHGKVTPHGAVPAAEFRPARSRSDFSDPEAYARPFTVKVGANWAPTRRCSNGCATRARAEASHIGSARRPMNGRTRSRLPRSPGPLRRHLRRAAAVLERRADHRALADTAPSHHDHRRKRTTRRRHGRQGTNR